MLFNHGGCGSFPKLFGQMVPKHAEFFFGFFSNCSYRADSMGRWPSCLTTGLPLNYFLTYLDRHHHDEVGRCRDGIAVAKAEDERNRGLTLLRMIRSINKANSNGTIIGAAINANEDLAATTWRPPRY